MRRNICSHTYCNTRRTVYKKIWITGRQNCRFFAVIVKVRNKINCIFLDIFKHFHSDFAHSAFSITVSSGRVAVNRTKVTVTVNKSVPHRKRLSKPNHCVINRCVAVRMIVTEHFTDSCCTLTVRSVRVKVVGVHCIKYSSVNRF